MARELNRLQRPLRKLRKSLKRFPKDPRAEDVHQLRTQARRMEALAAVLMFDRHGRERDLLKAVAALRRAAGGVRDMDVLIDNAQRVAGGELPERDHGCLEKLVDYLRAIRVQSASELHEAVAHRRKAALRDLKRYSKQVEKLVDAAKPGSSKLAVSTEQAISSLPVDPAAAALGFAAELCRWPRLRVDNIHPFRIKVKALRYVVELAEEPDGEFVSALDEVKDKIGEWHDWHELRRIAWKVLNHRGECRLRKQINRIERRKLKEALAAANAMRQRFLDRDTARALGKKQPSAHPRGGQAPTGGLRLAG
jgi:CHAD domain-containing protein